VSEIEDDATTLALGGGDLLLSSSDELQPSSSDKIRSYDWKSNVDLGSMNVIESEISS